MGGAAGGENLRERQLCLFHLIRFPNPKGLLAGSLVDWATAVSFKVAAGFKGVFTSLMERKEPNAIFTDCINLQKYVRFIINCPGCPPGWFICLLFCLICCICLFSCLRLPIGYVSHGSRLERHCCMWERGLWLSS